MSGHNGSHAPSWFDKNGRVSEGEGSKRVSQVSGKIFPEQKPRAAGRFRQETAMAVPIL